MVVLAKEIIVTLEALIFVPANYLKIASFSLEPLLRLSSFHQVLSSLQNCYVVISFLLSFIIFLLSVLSLVILLLLLFSSFFITFHDIGVTVCFTFYIFSKLCKSSHLSSTSTKKPTLLMGIYNYIYLIAYCRCENRQAR